MTFRYYFHSLFFPQKTWPCGFMVSMFIVARADLAPDWAAGPSTVPLLLDLQAMYPAHTAAAAVMYVSMLRAFPLCWIISLISEYWESWVRGSRHPQISGQYSLFVLQNTCTPDRAPNNSGVRLPSVPPVQDLLFFYSQIYFTVSVSWNRAWWESVDFGDRWPQVT